MIASQAATTSVTPVQPLTLRTLGPFLWVGIGWLVLSLALNARITSIDDGVALGWTLFLVLLCLADLIVLAKAMASAMNWVSSPADDRPAYAVQTAFWGFLKLACLGLFGLVLLKGRAIPTPSLLMGLSTLLIVPLVGGLWWSQRTLHHA